MNQYGHIPPELMGQMRGIFLGMFGGPEKLDCWLTTTAEELADTRNPKLRPLALDPKVIPAQFQSLMHHPHEVVDIILEQFDALLIFEYRARIVQYNGAFLSIVSDKLNGHVIEEKAGPDPDSLTCSIREKYGANLEVVQG
jgi:hypothetical protein